MNLGSSRRVCLPLLGRCSSHDSVTASSKSMTVLFCSGNDDDDSGMGLTGSGDESAAREEEEAKYLLQVNSYHICSNVHVQR